MRAPGRAFARVASASLLAVVAACGSPPSVRAETATLNWYVGPDRVDVNALARSCSAASAGKYRIQVVRMPTDVSERHAMLVRRLAAKDTTIDLLSLDSAFTAEFAAAQLLAPVPDDLAPGYTKDIATEALKAATYDDSLAVVPWWFDPQLLWFRGNVAERAGLSTTQASSWDDLIAGADRLGVTVQIEDRDGSSLAEWVSALVAGGGGTLLDGVGRNSRVGLETEAGRVAAGVVQFYQESSVGPGPSKSAVSEFASPTGGFLLAPSSVISDPQLAPVAGALGWAPYPRIGSASIAPLAGVGLAVPLYAPRSNLSYSAITCLTSPASMRAIMTSAGHSSSRLTTYDEPAVKAAYPMAPVTKPAVMTGRSVPGTPFWQAVRSAIDESWSPLADVSQLNTPERSQRFVRAALAGELP